MVSSCCAPLIERQKLLEKRVFTSTVFLEKVKNEAFGSMPSNVKVSYLDLIRIYAVFTLLEVRYITVILLLNFSLGKKSSDPQSPSYSPISATQRAQIQQRYESVEKRRQQKDEEERKRIENVKEREKALLEN